VCRRDLSLGFRVGLGVGVGLGAWTFPIATYLAARVAGRHFLSITSTEENR